MVSALFCYRLCILSYISRYAKWKIYTRIVRHASESLVIRFNRANSIRDPHLVITVPYVTRPSAGLAYGGDLGIMSADVIW